MGDSVRVKSAILPDDGVARPDIGAAERQRRLRLAGERAGMPRWLLRAARHYR